MSEVTETDNVDRVVVPVIEETLQIGKEEIVTGGVRVRVTAHKRSELVDEALTRRDVDVTRIAVNQFVDAVPVAREDGDTLIVPVFEEVLVVVKRIRLVEEIHVTQRRSEYHNPQTVIVRSEDAQVERLPA